MNEASSLRFTPYAWAKYAYLRDVGTTEIGGFGVAAAHDPLLIVDIALVEQECSSCTVELEGESIAELMERMAAAGVPPERCTRVWLHTHPGNSAQPSGTDEDTFEEIYGTAPWAVMAILANGGQCYARAQYGIGPGGSVELAMGVVWYEAFPASDHAAWDDEYLQYVTEKVWTAPAKVTHATDRGALARTQYDADDWLEKARQRVGGTESYGATDFECSDCKHAWSSYCRWDDFDDVCPQCGSHFVDLVLGKPSKNGKSHG